MKAIKWRCIPIVLMLSLYFSAGGALASATVQVQAAYHTILLYYQDAVNADTVEDSLVYLKLLQAYYENSGRAEALDTYNGGRAWVYYTYANAMIAFETGDYTSAWADFSALQEVKPTYHLDDEPPLPDTAYYYQFSMAMVKLEANDFTGVFEALKAARTAPSASVKLCEDAKKQAAETLRKEAQACCARGAHEQAQAYYHTYISYVNSEEGQFLLDQCIREHALRISAVSADAGNISLSWTGDAGVYTVSWSADLTGKTPPESREINGNAAKLTGLLPGTDYRVTVMAASGSAAETVGTLPAEKYPAQSLYVRDTETAGITRNRVILNSKQPDEILFQLDEKYYCWRDDYTFTAADLEEFSLYGFVTYENRSSNKIHASMYYLIRSPSTGVHASEKTTFDTPGDALPYPAWVNLEELLCEIAADYSSLPREQYTWEMYLEDMLFCKGNFTVK